MRRRRNPSESNPYGIDDRVWQRIVGSETPTIDKIMFAAALDPLLIHELDMIQPPKSLVECIQLGEMGTRGNLENYLRSVLIKWVMSNPPLVSNVREMVRNIARWDIRLGVWCAAACAESVLRFVPEGEDRPRLAVEAAKGWVFGIIDETAVRAASVAAHAAYDAVYEAALDYADVYEAAPAYSTYTAPAYSASIAAANAAAYADVGGDGDAAAAAYAAADAHSNWWAIHDEADTPDAAVFIRDVVIRAIETYPVEQP